jgi:SAM-dependent methyltransferase
VTASEPAPKAVPEEGTSIEPDWTAWLQRWEAQQSRGLPAREERFQVMIDFVRAAVGPAPKLVDLGCGPGSLTVRLADGLPGATVLAVDADPLLLELGRRAIGDRGGRIHWVQADLRDAGWMTGLPGQVDAALSTTALHWLSPEDLTGLVRRLAAVVRAGGVFLNGDNMTFDPHQAALQRVADRLSEEAARREGETASGETWQEWWAAVSAEPGFQALLRERSAAGWGGHPDHRMPGELTFLRAALLRAGFTEAGTVWQRLDNRVLAAIR